MYREILQYPVQGFLIAAAAKKRGKSRPNAFSLFKEETVEMIEWIDLKKTV